MESLLIREQYKVIEILHAEENYAALQAVDIRDREKTPYLLNVYEGAHLKTFLRSFHELRGCRDYREMFVWENHLVSVFSCREGLGIDQVFYKGAQINWQLRLMAAQALFQQAFSMWEYPPRISCAALLSENIRIHQEEQLLTFRYAVRPMGELERRELVFLLSDQIKKVLIHRWDSPIEERRFVRELCTGSEQSAVAVYGRWTAAEPLIRAAYERIEEKGALNRWLFLLFMNLRDWAETRLAGLRKSAKRRGGKGE